MIFIYCSRKILYPILVIFSIFSSLLFLYYKSQNKLVGEIILKKEENINLSGPLKIHTDKNGFVHIKAKTKADAFFGLGMMHARDRLFQIEINHRIATGRLSEIFGERALEIDKYIRTVGINRRADLDYKYLKTAKNHSDYFILYQNYVEGINYWANKNFKPIEFYLLWIKFKNFTIPDALALKRLYAFVMMSDYNNELIHHIINDYIGKDFLKIHYKKTLTESPLKNFTIIEESELDPKYNSIYNDSSQNFNYSAFSFEGLDIPNNIIEFDENVDEKINNEEHHSNSWVIHGNFTNTGKPLYFNDPHLANNYPNFNYLAKMYIDEIDNIISGSFIPGVPLLLIGGNKYFCFGITTDNRDVADFVEEKIDNPNITLAKYYYIDEKKFPLEIIKEKIFIKGQEKPFELIVKKTRNGPLIENIRKELNAFGMNMKYNPKGNSIGNALSLNLFFFQNNADHLLYYNVMFGKEINDFISKAGKYEGPSIAISFASVKGEIGYTPIGHYVIKQNPTSLFGKGYQSSYEGNFTKIPRNETPVLINPKKGYIVTANNYPFPIKYKYFCAHYSYQIRASRINNLIGEIIAKKKFSIEDGLRILEDTKDVFCSMMKPILVEILNKFKQKELFKHNKIWYYFLELISKFHCHFGYESRSATFYYIFEYKLAQNLLLKNKTNPTIKGFNNQKTVSSFLQKHTMYYSLYDILKNYNNFELCKRFNLKDTCEDFVFEVFIRMENYLKEYKFLEFSDNVQLVRKWGDVHLNYYPHFLDEVSLFRKIYTNFISSSGNRNTIKYSKPKLTTENPLTSYLSANTKMIYDLSDISRPFFCLDTGNSENILSRFYNNLQKDCIKSKLKKFKNYDFKNSKEFITISNSKK